MRSYHFNNNGLNGSVNNQLGVTATPNDESGFADDSMIPVKEKRNTSFHGDGLDHLGASGINANRYGESLSIMSDKSENKLTFKGSGISKGSKGGTITVEPPTTPESRPFLSALRISFFKRSATEAVPPEKKETLNMTMSTPHHGEQDEAIDEE